ncbi:MAG: T9SS type A sorting domain-containing protein [Calditrichaceae bacterium]|nr:T9SS type A sorting domain-containing protein [Calditrichaceae bacterium]MBN2708638.1 T9SS type A sorting domain-containing protein [Calditrichaceae bacterium]
MKKFILPTILSFVFLSAGIISAQWISDSLLNTPVCVYSGNQQEAAICKDQVGGVYVFWRDYRDETGMFGGDIYGQRLDANGIIKWTENGTVIQTTSYGEFAPQAVPDKNGGVILLWSQNPNGFYDYKLFCQRLDSTGNKLWGADGKTIAESNGTNSFPQITSDGRGGAYIVWMNLPATPGSTDIYLQHVDSTGSLYWPANGLAICDTSNSQSYPALCADGLGGVFIVWQDSRNISNPDIYAQYIDGDKNVLWPHNGLAICQASGSVEFPDIVGDGQGGVFIVWQDNRNIDNGIALQHVNAAGELLLDEQGVMICNAENTKSDVNIISDGNDGAYIIWQDERSGDCDIYAQYINQDAVPQWSANGIPIIAAANDQLTPAAIVDELGNCFMAWSDDRGDEWGDIYGQMINTSGNLLWDSEGIGMATANGYEQEEPVVEIISDGNFVLSWLDMRNETDFDIYVHKTNRDEHLVSAINYDYYPVCESYRLEQNYPNPFNPVTIIEIAIPESGFYTLKVYNIQGEKVAELINHKLNAGIYRFCFDASGLSSGTYFYTLKGNHISISKKMILLR